MLKQLAIRGFRGFPAFSLSNLGRVNLLVGPNNSGKTSVLEALHLLGVKGDLQGFLEPMIRRGEQIFVEDDRRVRRRVTISHLFHGHVIDVGSEFSVSSRNASRGESLRAVVSELAAQADDAAQRKLFEEVEEPLRLAVNIRWGGAKTFEVAIPVTSDGGLLQDALRRSRPEGEAPKVQFIATGALSVAEITSLFDRIVLTPGEDLVVEALRTIEPNLERIASVSPERALPYASSLNGKGGIIVKLRGVEARIPIGSLGDGVWRLLGLALALVGTAGGVLLVDEIDTGFHFTVMEDVWRLVFKTAERLGVQVFATTHSSDCWTSLAHVSEELGLSGDAATIQRIEPGRDSAVAFTPEQMIVAAHREIEVR